MFAVSANANVDNKKALGITSHPNISTPNSMLHVWHYVYGDPELIVTHLWLSCVNLCLYVGNPWPLYSGGFNLCVAILSDTNSVRRTDRRQAFFLFFWIVVVSFVACAVVL
jgi:hypothetical protein